MPRAPHLLTTAEVAQRLGRNRSTITRWVEAGRVTPALTTPGGHHLFRPSDVERLAARLADDEVVS